MTSSTTRGVARHRAWLLAVLVLAVAAGLLRLAHERELVRHDVLARAPQGDERTYATIARRVARGEDDDVPYQAPLYPTLLGGLARALGSPDGPALLASARAVQRLLGLVGASVAAALALRVTGRHRAAVVAFALVAFARPLLHAEGTLLREAPSAALLAALALAYAQALEGAPTLERHAGLGLALGLGLVLRENFAVVAGAVAVERALALGGALLRAKPSRPDPPRGRPTLASRLGRPEVVAALGLALGLALPLLPFDLKVARLGGGVHALPHWNSGCVFYLANRRDNPSAFYAPPPFVQTGNPEAEQAGFRAEAERRAGHALAPHEVSSFWLREGLSDVAAAPGTFLARVLQRLAASLAPWEMAHQRDLDVDARYSWVLRAPLPGMGALLVLAVLGAATALVGPRRPSERALWVVLGSWWLSLLVAAFTSRYRVPAVPLLAVAGARGLAGVVELGRAGRTRALAGSVATAVLAALAILVLLPLGRAQQDPSNALRSRGLAALEAGDGRGAALLLDEASLLRRDQDPAVLEPLAEAWLRAGQGRRAWAAYTLAATLAPGEANERGLAFAELQMARPRAAAARLEALLARSPGDPALVHLLDMARAASAKAPDAPFPEEARTDPRRLLR